MLEYPFISLKISAWKVCRSGRQALNIYRGNCSGSYLTPGLALGGKTRQEQFREGLTVSRGGGGCHELCVHFCAACGTRRLPPALSRRGCSGPRRHTRCPRSLEALPRPLQPFPRHRTRAEAAVPPHSLRPQGGRACPFTPAPGLAPHRHITMATHPTAPRQRQLRLPAAGSRPGRGRPGPARPGTARLGAARPVALSLPRVQTPYPAASAPGTAP